MNNDSIRFFGRVAAQTSAVLNRPTGASSISSDVSSYHRGRQYILDTLYGQLSPAQQAVWIAAFASEFNALTEAAKASIARK